jgi:ATP-dependent DNA ligase
MPSRTLFEVGSAPTAAMELPPMEARTAEELPSGMWEYEPKWDGFRCMAFKDSTEVELKGKSGKSLARFFPEVEMAFKDLPTKKIVLDGELVIEVDGALSFDALQMRLHPAASRIAKLSVETPARFVAFDCLTDAKGYPIAERPFCERRAALERFFKKIDGPTLELTPATTDRQNAMRWLKSGTAAFDGVIAKQLDLPYRFGERAMIKVKRLRTADCVVGGFRYGQGSKLVASLLLGLYDKEGLLHHVGFTSSIPQSDKAAFTSKLEKLISPPGFSGDSPGGPSRWATERSSEWQPLKPRLVAEVRYDHVTAGRFRHGTKFLRWRPDKKPGQCKLEQIER